MHPLKTFQILLFFWLFSLANPLFSLAQINRDGLAFVSNYTEKNFGESGQIWAIAQASNGIMYFGCNYGILSFNGAKWKLHVNQLSTLHRSLVVDKNNIVYYGAESDFGMMLPDKKGSLQFISLFEKGFPQKKQNPGFGAVWKTYIVDEKVFFQSFEKIFYTDLPIKFGKNGKLLNKIDTIAPETSFHLSFQVGNRFFVRQTGKGLFEVLNGKPVLIPGGERFGDLKIYTMLPYGASNFLIGTREEGFYIYSSNNKTEPIKKFNLQMTDEIINSGLYCGAKITENLFAAGTLSNGIFIFDSKGKIIEHFTANQGLQAQVIYSIFSENTLSESPDLWISTQESGIYKINLSNPFRYWNETNGLSGIVNDIIRFNQKLYVATGNGIFVQNVSEGVTSSFTKISNIYNCRSFTVFEDKKQKKSRLLVGTWDGIFEISENEVDLFCDEKSVYKLVTSKYDPDEIYVCKNDGFSVINTQGQKILSSKTETVGNRGVLNVAEYDKNVLFLGLLNSGVFYYDKKNNSGFLIDSVNSGLPMRGADYYVYSYNQNPVIACGQGLYSFDFKTRKVYNFYEFGKAFSGKTIGVLNFLETKENIFLTAYNNSGETENRLIKISKDTKTEQDSVFGKILPQQLILSQYNDSVLMWFSNSKGLYSYRKNQILKYQTPYNLLFNKISITGDSVIFAGSSTQHDSLTGMQKFSNIPNEFDFARNDIVFEFSAPFYLQENNTLYSYRLIGEADQWSVWTTETKTNFTNLDEGNYTFEVKARNIYNIESRTAKFSFRVNPPWYRTIWAYTGFGILIIGIIIGIVKLNTKRLVAEKQRLERIVEERTSEIRAKNVELEQQKEEIIAQRDEIERQRDHVIHQKEEIEKQRDQIAEQQHSIMDSIHYAKRIQSALLPPVDLLQSILPEHFVLFRPRDIVSGDFYWANKKDNKIIIAAADCTGHGVPGAFMSMLGMTFLNEIVNKLDDIHAHLILNELRKNVKKSLRQTGKDNEAKDGMDISLCIIDFDSMQLEFAGAYNPLYLIRNGEVETFKADRMPIGIYIKEKESFTNNTAELKKGDCLYIFSDGYVDQFGGPAGSKLMSGKFKEVLLEIHTFEPEIQKTKLNDFIEHWISFTNSKGEKFHQIDDMLVIGIKI